MEQCASHVVAQNAAVQLSVWIQQRYRYAALDPMTHLKLQKLAFYCYAAAMAVDADAALPDVVFEPWQHGPVQRTIWERYRQHGKQPLPPSGAPWVTLPPLAEQVMQDALDVYGVMRPWSLREQSHLESVWQEADAVKAPVIDREQMRAWAKAKFASERMAWPEYLAGSSSMRLDGVPVATHSSLRALADTVRAWDWTGHAAAAM